MVQRALTALNIQIRKSSLKIYIKFSKKIRPLWGFPIDIEQVVINILSNAVKFTKRDGRITVSGKHRANGTMAISVADNGVGIAAADVPKALANFGQVENVLDRYHEGTGLGLPLVASMANFMAAACKLKANQVSAPP